MLTAALRKQALFVALASTLIILLSGALMSEKAYAEQYYIPSDIPLYVTSLTSPAPGKAVMTVKDDYFADYEYQASTDKTFSTGIVRIKTTDPTATFTNLKQGKKYYFRAMGFTGGDNIIMSMWSKTKSLTIVMNNGKSKIKGTWTISSSNIPLVKKALKKKAKAKLQFKKNGSIVLVSKKKKTKLDTKLALGKWVALGKKKGQCVQNDTVTAKISIKGSKLTLKAGNKKIVCKKR